MQRRTTVCILFVPRSGAGSEVPGSQVKINKLPSAHRPARNRCGRIICYNNILSGVFRFATRSSAVFCTCFSHIIIIKLNFTRRFLFRYLYLPIVFDRVNVIYLDQLLFISFFFFFIVCLKRILNPDKMFLQIEEEFCYRRKYNINIVQ